MPVQAPVGVLVVDDQAAFRRAALDVIEATPGFVSLGDAASGEEALALVAELDPELVLLDVRMPVMDGIETARRLTAEHPGGVVVLISIDDPGELPQGVERCGARALIRKQDFGSLALRRLWDTHGSGTRGDRSPRARLFSRATAASRNEGASVSSVEYVGAVAQESGSVHRRALILSAALGAVLCGLGFAVVLTSDQPGDRPLIALGRVLIIAAPFAVGVWVSTQRHYERFGRLLIAGSFVWFFTTLAESSDSLLYSVGRIGAWVAEPVMILLILSFPSGRLRTTADRVLAAAMAAVFALLFLPTALVVEFYPEPAGWGSCGVDCPENAFMVLESEPAFVDTWLRPLREVAAVSVFVATAALLGLRVRRASHLMRLTLAPVLAIAIVRCLALPAYAIGRNLLGPTSAGLELIGWVFVLCFPALAVAFLVGVLRRRLRGGDALQRLALRLRDEPSAELSVVLGEALEDPSLEVAYWIPGPRARWVDAAGRDVTLPEKDSTRSTTEIRSVDGRVALLIHDRALDDQKEFVEAAGSLAMVALANRRLAAQVDASLQELLESRARIQAVADRERHRMERDLHDGAQQRLVALRVRLELAGELMREDPGRGAELVRELGSEAEEALEEVRALARGIYPSLLADRGIAEALRAAARRAPLRTTIDAKGVGRYPAELESAVYFCCLEALQNAEKHARASAVSISIEDDGALRFAVGDDGLGFAARSSGSGRGLTNMRDRIAAAGGELTIDSTPGKGTTVVGVIPLSRSAG